jgi:hypothetical protein
MARKLRPEERSSFEQALQDPQGSPLDQKLGRLMSHLREKRDTALALTPDLEIWFGKEFSPPSDSEE